MRELETYFFLILREHFDFFIVPLPPVLRVSNQENQKKKVLKKVGETEMSSSSRLFSVFHLKNHLI